MNDIIIRPNTKIGQLDAENDSKFLSECYVDNGIIELLIDPTESEAIILGRTGAGKTASLFKINERIDEDYSKLINLENVFLRYIDNSSIIKFLSENNVNLDLFYKYLWRHILTVEFLKLKYPHINDKGKFTQIINDLRDLIRKPEEKIALNYLEQWSDKYWIETIENIEEIVRTFSNDIKAGFEAGIFDNTISLEGGKDFSEEQKTLVKTRAEHIVNNLQISELSKVIELMNKHIFNDEKKPYYLLIDKLDENWVSMGVKFSLIRGLIEEIKHFRKIKNVKILVALRVDLYQLTIEKTRSSGFQEDKLSSFIYSIKWSDRNLKEIVNKRITFLFKRQYTNREISFDDLFPTTHSKNGSSWDYLIKRTFWRPRDILQFVNYCFDQSSDKSTIEWNAILRAEKEYSRDRLKSLYEEWHDVYPSLKYIIHILADRKEVNSFEEFTSSLDDEETIKLYTDLEKYEVTDSISLKVFEYVDENKAKDDISLEMLSCFYRVGLIGISSNLADSFDWSFQDAPFKTIFECNKTKWIKIHKMFHQALHTIIIA